MVFSSVVFLLLFLPIVLTVSTILYVLLKKIKIRFTIINLFLLISSLFFYFWGEPKHIIIMICATVINYLFGILIYKFNKKRIILLIGVIINLGILGYFKYFNFLMDLIGLDLINFFLTEEHKIKSIMSIALPLGISFYIFQGISYLIDVYRGEVKASINFINFACYITFFPQLVAGPIVRYSSIEKDLIYREITADRFAQGVSRFTMGLAKKILIADTLGRVANAAFAIPNGELSAFGAWLGIISYSLQIYFDFSGYSDMAIGLGMMFGFRFPENFNYPYISSSVQEFWRRWHISLSTWFRDYLYIPLGGNRKGAIRCYLNQIIVFLLCGLWHGASIMFVLWGLYHGLFLTLEKIFPKVINNIPRFIRHIYVILMFMFGWVLFRANTFEQAVNYYKSLFGFYPEHIKESMVYLNAFAGDYIIALIAGIILSTPVFPYLRSKYQIIFYNAGSVKKTAMAGISSLMILLLFLICIMPLFGSTFKSFIYFRF